MTGYATQFRAGDAAASCSRNEAADRAIPDTTAEAQSALQRANDELAEVRRREAEG